jgi:hypothetical protein
MDVKVFNRLREIRREFRTEEEEDKIISLLYFMCFCLLQLPLNIGIMKGELSSHSFYLELIKRCVFKKDRTCILRVIKRCV